MSEQNKQQSLRAQSTAGSDTTVAQSKVPSVLDQKEAGESVMPSAAPSMREKPVEPQGADERMENASQASASAEEEDFEYPKAWKLAIITLALCLSVFCMALVRASPSPSLPCWSPNYFFRTTPLSRPLFPGSPTSSKRSTMLGGTVRRTSSRRARPNLSTGNSTPFTLLNGSTSPPSSSSK